MSKHSKQPSQLALSFQRLMPRLRAAGKRLLGNDDEAEDAIQDTFVKLWRSVSEPSVSDGLVITSLRNTCIDNLRRRHQSDSSDLGDFVETETDTADEAQNALYDEVSRLIDSYLSPRDREILLMRDRDEFEMDAIAERMDMTEANVRVVLSRARRAVREAYRQVHNHDR